MPPLERCVQLDSRIKAKYDPLKVKALGYASFHQAVASMLLSGMRRRSAIDALGVECETLVQNAAVRLGLQWSKAKTKKKHVITKHQPSKSTTQYLTDKNNTRNCSRCGKTFVPTVQRRLLCQGCFAGAETDSLSKISLKGVY